MNPDQLLQQIKSLLDQYLAMGANTPVAAEAQALSDAIDSNSTGQMQPPVDANTVDPTAGGDPLSGAVGGPPQHHPNGYSGGDMAQARAGAKDFLARMDQKKKTKAPLGTVGK